MTRPLILACGALVSELRAVLGQAGLSDAVEVSFLPAPLHNHPDRIVPELADRLTDVDTDRPIFLGYADCGTGGLLDAFIESAEHSITRLPGAHCYEFFAGGSQFAELHEEELGTFYLTDFLAKHFDALIWRGFGIEEHPELRDLYFAHYRRVVLLSQREDAAVVDAARTAADRLGLEFHHVHTGLDTFATPVTLALAGASS
ncbi:MAG: DUF1638 domain-containing protein [Ilumatobacter sp.]|uniref:DUF1638 domain-containing protein n=1 Tax=Ilumatobacter sp. TaxID=1967498 RepID=UPI0026349BDD|nr:DUF1638 domain-containing protein [Ilumatobacter sp.]MDJ0769102.1 DUF1638 domain-containing protein [Ilumatobacter sp.]